MIAELMPWIILLGACVGSLLNVVVYRLPQMIMQPDQVRYSLWLPRSHCPQCQRTIAWYDNLPLLSWLLLHGRCRHCAQPIALRYPLTELTAALLALLMGLLFPPGETLLAALLLSWLLLALVLIDAEHLLLPDALTLPLLWLGLICQLCRWLPASSLEDGVCGAIAGYLTFWLLAKGYYALRGREALGMGDAKLLAALGAWLGWQLLPQLLLLASLSAISWVAAARLLARRPLNAPLPFGPGLALAGLLLFIARNGYWLDGMR